MPTDSSSADDQLSSALFARWYRASPELCVTGQLKTTPEDFLVIERASHTDVAAEDGPHLYLYIEKRGMTSTEVVRLLANANGLPTSSIGYAGMKDKFAVTRQWLSVPLEEAPPDVVVPAEVIELARLRATKKLRRGWHAGNDFELVLREVSGATRTAISERLALIAEQGVPNYFGPQRFGYNNVPEAIAWLPRRRKERNAFKRGLHLSVLRSLLFNEVLSAHIAEGSYAQTVDKATAAALAEAELAESFSGPLWGRGRVQTSAAGVEFEAQVLAPYSDLCGELEYAGLKQERRALRLLPRELRWEWQDDNTLMLRFGLPVGAYATSVLRELGEFEQPLHTMPLEATA